MKSLSATDLKFALDAVGVENGDCVLVHSSAMAFGLPENGLNTFLDGFLDCIGDQGVLAAPTFSFSFISSGHYHYQHTKSVGMGAFNEFIRNMPSSFRTKHPLHSIAMIGNINMDFHSNTPYSAYEPGGTFDLMGLKGFKIVTLGVSPKFISHSHLCEEKNKVPYRFMKRISGSSVLGANSDENISGEWGFFARHPDIPANPQKEDIIVTELKNENKWAETELNGAPISVGLARDFTDRLNERLAVNPYWMLDNQDEVATLLKDKI